MLDFVAYFVRFTLFMFVGIGTRFIFDPEVSIYMVAPLWAAMGLAKVWWDYRREVRFSLVELLIVILAFQISIAAILNPWHSWYLIIVGVSLSLACLFGVTEWQRRRIILQRGRDARATNSILTS